MDDINQENSPRAVLRDGNLKATIWRNEGEKGPFYATSLARTYKDEQGNLRDTHSFAGNELLRISELARKAYDRTRDLHREDRQSRASANERDGESPRKDFNAKRSQKNQTPAHGRTER